MKLKILFLSLLLASCASNQDFLIREMLITKKELVKDKALVMESLGQIAENFFLSIEPGADLASPKGRFPVFIIRGDSLPYQERFLIASIDRITRQIDLQCEFEVLEDNLLAIYKNGAVSYEKEIPFLALGNLKAGCPVDYVLVSKKTRRCATAEFIPYPLAAFGEAGERIEALVAHPMGTRFHLRAQGFRPNERLLLIHRSGGRIEEQQIAADAHGVFFLNMNPTILGRLGGEASATIQREEGADLRLDYPWGTAIDKKTWKERSMFPMLFVANRKAEEPYSSQLIALIKCELT